MYLGWRDVMRSLLIIIMEIMLLALNLKLYTEFFKERVKKNAD